MGKDDQWKLFSYSKENENQNLTDFYVTIELSQANQKGLQLICWSCKKWYFFAGSSNTFASSKNITTLGKWLENDCI